MCFPSSADREKQTKHMFKSMQMHAEDIAVAAGERGRGAVVVGGGGGLTATRSLLAREPPAPPPLPPPCKL